LLATEVIIVQFNTVKLDRLGPFGSEQSINLSSPLNFVQGPSGSGKTTIATELMREFQATYDNDIVPLEQALVLSFLGEDYAYQHLRNSTTLTPPLKAALADAPSNFVETSTFYLNQLMHEKISSGMSKFGDTDRHTRPLAVSLSEDGRFNILDSFGKDMSSFFLAAGEQFVIALATNLAIRDMLGYCEPIVVDGAFGMLDNFLLTSCFRAIVERSEQRIILHSEQVFRYVAASPDFVILHKPYGFSEVKALRV
jgi:hypothetical protein